MIVLRLLLLPGGLGSSAALTLPLGCHGAAFTMIRILVVTALGALALELAAPPPVGLQRHGLPRPSKLTRSRAHGLTGSRAHGLFASVFFVIFHIRQHWPFLLKRTSSSFVFYNSFKRRKTDIFEHSICKVAKCVVSFESQLFSCKIVEAKSL